MNKPRIVRFTKDGFESLQNELLKLRETRKEAVVELRRAAEMGDRSENAAYKVGRQKLSSIDSRIRHLNKISRHAEIITSSNQDFVDIGSYVTVTDGKSTFTYQVVGDYEADSFKNKISPNSPIGKALMGKKVGDIVSVRIPTGVVKYKVWKIQ